MTGRKTRHILMTCTAITVCSCVKQMADRSIRKPLAKHSKNFSDLCESPKRNKLNFRGYVSPDKCTR